MKKLSSIPVEIGDLPYSLKLKLGAFGALSLPQNFWYEVMMRRAKMIGPLYGGLADEKSSVIPRLLPFLLCKARHSFSSDWIDGHRYVVVEELDSEEEEEEEDDYNDESYRIPGYRCDVLALDIDEQGEHEGVYRFLVQNSYLLTRGLLIRKPEVNTEK